MSKIPKTIYWDDGAVMVLDQTLLPHKLQYVRCAGYLDVCECIVNMRVRGAPALGIASAMGIALGAQAVEAADGKELLGGLGPVFEALLATRPTAVNIEWAVLRMTALLESHSAEPAGELKALLIEEAERVLREDIEVNRAIGRWGEPFVPPGARVLTHCNAGALATGGVGTATGPILAAHEAGKDISVFADETRPLLQGARLTCWELMQAGVPVTLITDNAAGALMSRGEIDLVIVGTDRTARNGDVANKIGTYTVAVLAREHGIPFYVAAPLSSIDFSMASGEEIPIEERDPLEVTNVVGMADIAPEGVAVRNIAFDVTPARLVTAIITERGAFRPADLHNLAEPGADLEALRLKAPGEAARI